MKSRSTICRKCPPIRRRLHVYFRTADRLDLLANFALVAITVCSVHTFQDAFELPKLILACAVGYIALTIWRLIVVARTRSGTGYELRRSVCQVFHSLYEEMFDSAPMQEWMRILERTLDRLYEDKMAE